MSDVTFDMRSNSMHVHQHHAEPWRVTLVDTGDDTMTGGRVKRIADYVKDENAFCMTYGDGLSDVNINRPGFELTPKSWTIALPPTKRSFSAGTRPD
jgi:glucose-1-phosphate cytidylyltransferase